MSETETAVDAAVLRVTGFLGAGKTTIVRALTGRDPEDAAPFEDQDGGPCRGADGQALRVIEATPFEVPAAGMPGQIVVAAVDAINATANLADPLLRDLVAGQIQAADLVVLTCGDIGGPDPARQAITALTEVPVIVAHGQADLAGAILERARPRVGSRQAAADHRQAFTVWSYTGSAVLTKDAMTAFLQRRPAGAYRIRGVVRLGEEGGRVDVFGRGRRTSVTECPAETWLTVAGPTARLSARSMELAFAETVMDAAYGRGVIACR